MIFIGAELSDPHAHFVTNIVTCIGSDDDLIIDLLEGSGSEEIFRRITRHLRNHDEQYVIYNAYTVEDFFFDLGKRFPQLRLITVFSDDEWRHANYDRYLALYSDAFTIAVKRNLKVYQEYGLDAFYMQWGCNPEMFYPLETQIEELDVSFIGAAYGQRTDYVRFLIANGVNIRVFGRGWERYPDVRLNWGGYLSHKEMLEVISNSKINLNFLWTSAEKERCTIKGRTLELSACRAFQLSNHTDEFANYGFVDGENIAVFSDRKSALEKICYYLKNEDERNAIAERAYSHVLQNHTWRQRFQDIFARLDNLLAASAEVKDKYRVMLLVRKGLQHHVSAIDERLVLYFANPEGDWKGVAASMDGVIWLDHESTLNNNTLYMMVFGLLADKSDLIAANFNAGCRRKPYWIRFIDRMVEKRRELLRMLPISCLMFSGKHAAEHGCELVLDLSTQKVSYIEHPSFWIKLPYYQSRILRLYFAYHGDSLQQFKIYTRSLNIGQALSLGIDKVWQKAMQNRIGA